MKTYIRKSIKGYYIEFPEEIDAEYWEGKIGTTYEDFQDNKWILLSEGQIEFHESNPTASIQEVLSMLFIQPQRTLEQAKEEMIKRIDEYDNSSSVNEFTVNNTITGWFTPEQRSNYKSSIDAAKLLGMTSLSFFISDLEMTVDPSQAEVMLAQIQLYADACYIVTKEHKIAVEALNTVEEVDAFNYSYGYPTKINFTYPIE